MKTIEQIMDEVVAADYEHKSWLVDLYVCLLHKDIKDRVKLVELAKSILDTVEYIENAKKEA